MTERDDDDLDRDDTEKADDNSDDVVDLQPCILTA